MAATLGSAKYAAIGRKVSLAAAETKTDAVTGNMVARRNLLDEMPGIALGLITIVYIVTSMLALA